MNSKFTVLILVVMFFAACNSDELKLTSEVEDETIELRSEPSMDVAIVYARHPGPGGADPCKDYGMCMKKDDFFLAILEEEDERLEDELITQVLADNECLAKYTRLSSTSFRVDLIASPEFFEADLSNRAVKKGLYSVCQDGTFSEAMQLFEMKYTSGVKAGDYKLLDGGDNYWSGYFVVTEQTVFERNLDG